MYVQVSLKSYKIDIVILFTGSPCFIVYYNTGPFPPKF